MKAVLKVLPDYSLLIEPTAKEKIIKKYQVGDYLSADLKPHKDTVRSLPQHRMYWLLMNWLSYNSPEYILRVLNTKYLSADSWHILSKSKYGIDSTAFDNMDQMSFQAYFDAIKVWIADLIGVEAEQMMYEVEKGAA